MRGQDIRLDGVSVRFGAMTAVVPTDLEIRAGEFFSILGPSGCGKTTLLRLISGFVLPTTGKILIGGQDMTPLGPNARPTALIFQNLALFPLMSVRENVAFGLEARGWPRAKREARADELLALVALDGQGGKRPTELSGGQRQRVAIARALAVEPAVLLLDEPLSALDLKLRQHMRAELKGLQRRTGITFVYITHDQGEALAMSDRVAVMSRGRIEQVDTPEALYAAPKTAFVATFVGEQNVIPGRVSAIAGDEARIETPLGVLTGRAGAAGLAPGAEAFALIRPERLGLAGPGAMALASGTVLRRDFEGATATLVVDAGGQPLTAQVPFAPGLPETGAAVGLAAAPGDVLVLPHGDVARV
jgi:spermidine/putrescine transport system ATP-binding protein